MNIIKKKLVVGILARDCNSALLQNIPKIEQLCSAFISYDIFILENDSKDGTKNTLSEWRKNNSSVHIDLSDTNTITIPKGTEQIKYPGASSYRIEKMAVLREKLLNWIRKDCNPDICLFLDVDICDFSVSGVISSILNAPKNWGGLFANGTHTFEINGKKKRIPFQYDYFAYVPQNVSPEQQMGKHFFDVWFCPWTEWQLDRAIRKSKYLPCNSAFCGIGIYKWEIIKTFHYKTYPTSYFKTVGCSLCEHIPFNLRIIDLGYQNYISKELIVDYGDRISWDKNSLLFRFSPLLYGFKDVIYHYFALIPKFIFNLYKCWAYEKNKNIN